MNRRAFLGLGAGAAAGVVVGAALLPAAVPDTVKLVGGGPRPGVPGFGLRGAEGRNFIDALTEQMARNAAYTIDKACLGALR